MSTRRRWGASAAVLWYLVIGFGVPLLDGTLFHRDDLPRTPHVESSETDCHRGECSLEAPGAPQSPTASPLGGARFDDGLHSTAASYPPPEPRDRRPGRVHSPRAPPRFT